MDSKNLELLSNGSIPRTLVKLGIPTMIGMMVSALYNLVDSYFVGTLGTLQQAAVSAVYPLSLILLGIGLLFGSGSASYVSRLLGSGNKKRADETASTALYTSLFAGILVVAVILIFLDPILKLLGCTDAMMPYAKSYSVPFVLGLIINVVNVSMSHLATSEGQPIYSMRSMLIGGIINVILDPIFILALNLGVAGAAYATLIARIVSFILYLSFSFSKKNILNYSIKNFRFDLKIYGEIAKIGVPTMIYQILCSVVLSLTNNLAKPFGESAIAAISIVNRIISLFMMIIMGFCEGFQTFVGFNYGANNYKRVKDSTKFMVLISTVFCVVASAVLILLRYPIINAFNPNDAKVLEIGSKALLFNGVTLLTYGFQLVYANKYMAMGKAVEGGLVSLGRQGIFFIPAVYILSAVFGINGIILAQPVADLLSMGLVAVLAINNIKSEHRLMNAVSLND